MQPAGNVLRHQYAEARRLTRGVLACAMVSLAAAFLAENYQAPIMLFALLLGMLSGGAVAICGISAAMTLSSTMPHNAQNARNTLLTVILVASIGAAAMVVYPVLAAWMQLGELATGVFLGGSIHDVSHVVGASYVFTGSVTDYAMIVKMLRVACLLPVAWLFILFFRARSENEARTGSLRLPWFLVVFVAIAVVNNFSLIPPGAAQLADKISGACFVAAITALGIKTALRDLLAVGWRPMLLIFLESSFLGVLVLGWALYLQ